MGQNTSPYSRFGIGELQNTEQAHLQAMGGLSSAYIDSVQTNLSNASTLGAKQFSTLDFALNLGYHNIRDQNNVHDAVSGGVSYLGYSFPVNKAKTWGMALGARPYSSKEYSVTQPVENNTYFRDFEGDGNTYNLFWQNGVEIADQFRLGLDAAIFFGSLTDETYNNFLGGSTNSSGQRLQQKLRGFSFKASSQYTVDLKNNLDLVLGANYQIESEISNELTRENFKFEIPQTQIEVLEDGTLNVLQRTEFDNQETVTDTDLTIPAELGVGAFLRKPEKFSLGIDANFGFWEDFQAVNDAAIIDYDNSFDIRLGGSFIPKYRNPSRAFESYEYRYGGHYSQSYLTVNGTTVNEYGVTLGVSLPINQNRPGARIRRIPSNVDFAIDIGQRGTLDNNLVQDSYITGTLGVNLNDLWFIREKYD